MRISEYFDLGLSQGALDFVDVDTTGDVPVFIDPRAARRQRGEWGRSCRDFLYTHFVQVLAAIEADNRQRLYYLLATGEPNETHLGWSRGVRSRGRGARESIADLMANSLEASVAAREGLMSSLEDAMLLVPGVGPDLTSDQVTHVLRGPLIGYTQSWCEFLGIPMQRQHAGRVWHPSKAEWDDVHDDLPRTEFGPLLLVPKSMVRYHVSTDTDRYYNGYLAPLLENKEVIDETRIVKEYKNGRRYVLRPDLHEKYPVDKPAVVQHTVEYPQALKNYRESEDVDRKYPPLDHQDFKTRLQSPVPAFMDLYDAVAAIIPGRPGAHSFHLNVVALLSALFYPSLGNATVEQEIHEGRKRIDVAYDNIATTGFFRWLSLHYSAATISVECKNYSRDIANEELDQLSGRFSPARGRVGILVTRQFNNKSLFLKRCRDTANDDRGWIIPLDDQDLHDLADEAESLKKESREDRLHFPLLRERFQYLIG